MAHGHANPVTSLGQPNRSSLDPPPIRHRAYFQTGFNPVKTEEIPQSIKSQSDPLLSSENGFERENGLNSR